MRFAFIDEEKANYPLRILLRVMEVSESGFYDWKNREPSKRACVDEKVKKLMKAIQKQQRGFLGVPRMRKALRHLGHHLSKERVRRLMHEAGAAWKRRKPFVVTTTTAPDAKFADNILDRHFNPEAPNVVWAADITYIITDEGHMYLAVVMDLHSRAIIGWCLEEHMRTDLVTRAFEMAVRNRRPPRGLLHHSDRGVQYTSGDFKLLLDVTGGVLSMSRKGECWDNAVLESFFGTLKLELGDRWATKFEARRCIPRYIETFYNTVRMHSTLNCLAPMQFEKKAATLKMAA